MGKRESWLSRALLGGAVVSCLLIAPGLHASAQTIVVQGQSPQPVQQPVQQQPVVVAQRPPAAYAAPSYSGGSAVVGTRGPGAGLRWSLIGPGVGLLLGGWIANAITGTVGALDIGLNGNDRSPQASQVLGLSFIPIIGPFANAAYWGGQEGSEGYVGTHIVWGILQSAGLVLCILGTVFQEEVVVTQVALGDGEDAPRLTMLPYASNDGAGLTAQLAGF